MSKNETKASSNKCYWHPDRKAEYIVNLGTLIDKDTLACTSCASKILEGKRHGSNSDAQVVKI